MSSQCTCTTDKEATCIVHPTTRSLKERIEELEGELDRARVIYVDDINTLKRERDALVEAAKWLRGFKADIEFVAEREAHDDKELALAVKERISAYEEKDI